MYLFILNKDGKDVENMGEGSYYNINPAVQAVGEVESVSRLLVILVLKVASVIYLEYIPICCSHLREGEWIFHTTVEQSWGKVSWKEEE